MDFLQKEGIIVGTCLKMCPDKEYRFRKKHNLLHKLEGKNRESCVKEFRRSAAGEVVCDPSTLRSDQVLLRTIDHLFEKILFGNDVSFATKFDFVFDRLRSVRQDAAIQQLSHVKPYSYAMILEKCCRFYLYSLQVMTLSPELPIDGHIVKEHTQNCLKSLLDTYRLVRFTFGDKDGLRSCLNMLSAYLLLNAHSSDALRSVLPSIPTGLRELQPLQASIAVCTAVSHKNYVRFGRLVLHNYAEGHFALLCALTSSLNEARNDAVRLLSHSHHSKVGTYPGPHLREWLLVESGEDAARFCAQCGMQVKDGCVRFMKGDYAPCAEPAVGCSVRHAIGQMTSGGRLASLLMGTW